MSQFATRDRFLSPAAQSSAPVQRTLQLHSLHSAQPAQRLPQRSVVSSTVARAAGQMPSGLAAGKQHDGLLPRHINFDRLDEQAAHQPADLLAATRAQSADAPEKEQTHNRAEAAQSAAPPMQTDGRNSNASSAQLMDDGLDEEMAALPFDAPEEAYRSPSAKRGNDEAADGEPLTKRQQTEASFAALFECSTADLLSLQEWSDFAARQQLETDDVVRQMQLVRECMARLYANFRQELLGCVEQSSALFGETLEQVDTAMLATRELFCRNDQDVAALQSEHEQQLVNVSNAAPQLQLLANMRK